MAWIAWSLAGLVVLLALLALGVVAVGRFLYRPRVWREQMRDVLILAAHQDDCVVMAGEYAIEAVEAGRRVEVLYLTNGDSKEESPWSERACRRKQEAMAAWGSIGVGPDSIHLLGFSAAPIPGPSRITDEHSREARRRIVELIAAMPKDSAVFIPAMGELHVDHRTLRQIALQALKQTGRDDLHIFEAPEYNSYLSLLRMPRKTFIYILAGIPLIRRWAGEMRREIAAPEEFPSGPRATIMPPDAARLERKRRMLEMFVSENGQKLARVFGGSGRFRRITNIEAALRDRPRGYLPLGAYRVGMMSLAGILVWLAQ
ncbi:MAG TPA: PIG-L family deacetylase [Tepidisphaeraceae bacterium]|jgi:LmbE family N-acetylglucosaminyl deacetylase|nr:PIG-L family deacetylase [Tepidisphaeraceae bacterium]